VKPRSNPSPKQVKALKVHQWLEEWGKVHFDARKRRAKPQDHFYLFSLDAYQLKALSGIERRSTAARLGQRDDLERS
jgi:hypothetical protein